MLFARSIVLAVLPCSGFIFGVYGVIFGARGMAKRKVNLTGKRALTGRTAYWASAFCLCCGLGLIGLTIWSWQFLPD